MKSKYSRDQLIQQLEDVLCSCGAKPSGWPKNCRARLSAFIETDCEGARLHAEARALDRALDCAPKGKCCTALRDKILAAACQCPQSQSPDRSEHIVNFGDALPKRRLPLREPFSFDMSRPLWGGAMLAASLVLGVYIGLSGEALPTLQNMALLTSDEYEEDLSFPQQLFNSDLQQERNQL